ncbi:hypothetical protein CVT26_012856 [Gymnopilus dilepis]|uniref:G domain-containing protein n=1 Tax=Gymnopilus dilepis TaxID=231916 RepID=A0A409WDM2_9AGAR|nr:hypothetical protein CVT26_012856 [Gymnopilus dilepis]
MFSSNTSAAFELRQKYDHFRILIIGRANAGKTTILKRVCNTTEDPQLYDEGRNLLEPTSARGIHDINHPFVFASNPQFVFHDSPGFEAGGAAELEAVQSFIAERAKSRDVNDQLHAIWFCFEPDTSRPLLELEKRFFNEQRPITVPLVAIFTKFDDLIKEVWDDEQQESENRLIAANTLKWKFEDPLCQSVFPPKAYLCLEEMHKDNSPHQDQVQNLIKKTADSLDDLALKVLFVSVQQNNLELCIEYAVR